MSIKVYIIILTPDYRSHLASVLIPFKVHRKGVDAVAKTSVTFRTILKYMTKMSSTLHVYKINVQKIMVYT